MRGKFAITTNFPGGASPARGFAAIAMLWFGL